MVSSRLVVAATATVLSTLGMTSCVPSNGDSATAPPTKSEPASIPSAESVGAPGIGDPDFPLDGNGGYDVGRYRLKLGYDPGTKHLTGVATIEAKATQQLARFNLDLSGFTINRITVDGRPARYERSGGELTVIPATPVADRASFAVEVAYAGEPKPVRDSSNLGTYGFIPTPDGAFVTCQPNGARTWFPGNDHPLDKARYDFEITVPKGVTALANGELVGEPKTTGGRTTFVWREDDPMASYLATMTLGKFEMRQGKTRTGIRNLAAVDPKFRGSLDNLYKLSAEMTDYWSTVFGPYPFDSTGGIVDDFPAGYALENQTKPVYGGFDPDEDIISHELAHQWFGNSLTIKRWRELWLNEGFATYAEWLWSEHRGLATAEQLFRRNYSAPADAPIWSYPAGEARPDDLFNSSVYVRGGMTLHALRQRIGEEAFFRLLKDWNTQHRYGHVTTAEFIALAEKISGKDLDALFDAWLFTPEKPTTW
ncbi:aminopeptidase N [Streptosporangium becharense]|uniref:Aminopeptidase N n=1 Tax=Streptosporangium becharense TaxID=1816182 RepID=A0A7W9IIK6_9ACTN|nr:M1 family metallopeptidase [Streptosporangium becharense]MBB2913400.1 aminopeptidase N [Streptosporangium becharense]MBB5821090.1 aminopeptidase N [Streptosporangium becharense]